MKKYIIILFLFCFWLLIPTLKALSYKAVDDSNPMIFLMNVQGFTKRSNILGYVSLSPNRKSYIPIESFITEMQYNITETSPGILIGTFNNGKNKISLNFNTGVFLLNNKAVNLDAKDIFCKGLRKTFSFQSQNIKYILHIKVV